MDLVGFMLVRGVYGNVLHTFVLDPHILVGIVQYFRHGNMVYIARQTMFMSVIVHFPVSNLHYFVKFPFRVGNLHSSRKFSFYEAILHIPYVFLELFVVLMLHVSSSFLASKVIHSWCYYVYLEVLGPFSVGCLCH